MKVKLAKGRKVPGKDLARILDYFDCFTLAQACCVSELLQQEAATAVEATLQEATGEQLEVDLVKLATSTPNALVIFRAAAAGYTVHVTVLVTPSGERRCAR